LITYPGLDITAGVLPFEVLLRAGATGGVRGGCSGSVTFCRFVRLSGAFAGSGSGGGLGSRAGALRFRDAGGGRVDEAAAAGTPAEAPDDSEELAACLADARVILRDMSIWFLMNAFSTLRRLCATRLEGCKRLRQVEVADVDVDIDLQVEMEGVK
jgi:hypothetical protein